MIYNHVLFKKTSKMTKLCCFNHHNPPFLGILSTVLIIMIIIIPLYYNCRQLHSYNIQAVTHDRHSTTVTHDRNSTAQTWSVCNKGITVSPATHTRTVPCLYSQPQGITALRLVLTKGWPGWVNLGGWLIEQGLTSHQTHSRSYRGRFLQVIWPNQQCQSTEGN